LRIHCSTLRPTPLSLYAFTVSREPAITRQTTRPRAMATSTASVAKDWT